MQPVDLFEQRPVERVDDPREADAMVLRHLSSLGCNPKEARGTRHFIYVPEAAAADAVAQALEREGWETWVRRSEDVWLVVAACLRVLSEPLVRATRVRLETLAAAHGGSYDGWEAERV